MLLNCMREAYRSQPRYATPTGQAPRALPSPRCGKHASPGRRSPSGSSMWSTSEPAHNDACLKQRLVLQCGVGDGGARAAGDVWACSDKCRPSRFRDFGGPGPGQQRRRGEGYHGGAEQHRFLIQFSAALDAPTADSDTCFSGIPVRPGGGWVGFAGGGLRVGRGERSAPGLRPLSRPLIRWA